MGRNILITGSTGAIGSILIEKLLSQTDDNLFLIIRGDKNEIREKIKKIKIEDENGKRVKVLNLSLDKPIVCEYDINIIIHLAGCVHLGKGKDDILHESNVVATKNIIRFAKRLKNLEHFVHTSTFYITNYFAGPFNNMYERTKKEAERLMSDFTNENHGISVVIIKPSIVIGVQGTGTILGCSGLCAYFNVIYNILNMGQKINNITLPGRKDALVNFIFSDWLVEVLLKILEKRSVGEILLINHNPLTLGEIVDNGLRALNFHGKVSYGTGKSKEKHDRIICKALESFGVYTSKSILPNTDETVSSWGMNHPLIDGDEIFRHIIFYKKNYY